MADVILESVSDGLCTLTLNRPERKNAMSPELLQGLRDAALRAAADPQVGAVMLCAAGDTFCVGGDVKAMAAGRNRDMGVDERVADLRRKMEAARILHDMPKPTIAVVRGAAAGAGLSLALACDFRIVSRNARFTTAFAKVALSGDFGGSWFLSKIVGTARARELYLTSPILNAEQALAIGLVTQVADDAELDAAATEFAIKLARGPRVTLGYIKQNLNFAETGTLAEALDQEAMHHVRSSLTDDHKEAAAAFVEKRPPVFSGR